MSLSSKERKRKEVLEDNRLGGIFPSIEVDYTDGDAFLMWVYHIAPFQVRLEIPLTGKADETSWLYLDGDDFLLDDDATRTQAEAQYGAMTRVRLMEAHLEAIRANAEAGVAQLEAAATAAGLYGKRERRHCVVPSWQTLDEAKAAPLLIE